LILRLKIIFAVIIYVLRSFYGVLRFSGISPRWYRRQKLIQLLYLNIGPVCAISKSPNFLRLFSLGLIITLIQFSVWRTDRSNAKFATFGSGKTDNARRRQAAEILPPSLLDAELV